MQRREFSKLKREIFKKGGTVKVVNEPELCRLLLETEGIIEVQGFGDDRRFQKDPKYKVPNLWKRYPFIEKLILIIIATMFALIANLFLSKSSRQSQRLKDTQQDSLIKDVTDSVRKIQSDRIH